jgi:hypothetical protein
MDSSEMKKTWDLRFQKLKLRFPMLNPKELYFDEGNPEELFARLQVKLGKTKEEFKAIWEKL